ncbi:MAG: penicillin-binding transpeptidase domain-containing protein, partial [Bacteroidales bacterium]
VWRPIYSHDEIEPENGRDIISTIHVRIQDVAQAALRRCMEENEAQHGCAILMEVSTGRITAIANLMKQADGTYDESMNYAIGESVEPGSTFKLASVIAILEDGRYDTSTMVPTGVMEFSNRKMVDSHRGGYGQISLKSAFEKSSNVGISYLVYESFHSDPQKFVDYLYKMGLNTKLGLEIAGEGAPYIKSTSSKTWSKISLPWMSIGYELRLTPLQILSLYNAVANDGKLMKPQFVKEIKQGDKVVREFQPVVLKDHICSRSTLNKVKGLLEGVVEKGTARSLSHSPYKVAGKTGTAQINYANRGVQKMSYRASFVGYFPADDPKYSCIVMITNPQKNRRYGGEVAAPVFKEIGDKVYATLLQNYKGKNVEILGDSIQKTPLLAAGYGRDIQKIYRAFQLVDAQVEPTAFVRLSGRESAKEEREEFQTISLVKDQMPNVCGLGLRDAVFILEKYGLKVQIYGRGMVKKQSVPVGTPCVHGQTVILELA